MKKAPQLNQLRELITSLDNELLSLLAKRRHLSIEVARSKEADIRPIRDTLREKELLARLVQQGRAQGLDAHYVLSLYHTIIEDSVLNQQAYLQGQANPNSQKQRMAVAYLGARGTYSYLAASRYCQRRQVEMHDIGCSSFDEIAQTVESGHADYGFLPIENTSSGSINEVFDLLQHTNLAIVGETTIDVGHCLLAKPDSLMSDIQTLYAHPQPISQCSQYLARHGHLKLQYCSSSAEAMEKVLQGDRSVAAIGSAEGGALYGLEALESGLANQKVNRTRFIVVARKPIDVPEQVPAKTTLIMATGQKPGALVDTLLVLKAHNINMSKLESRPITGTPWEEMFYLDVDANLASASMQQALKELERSARFIKVLGCYASETVKPTQLEHGQLLIEPESSKSTKQTPRDARHSRQFKPSSTEVQLGQTLIGEQHYAALAQMPIEWFHESFSAHATALKEAGFQAMIITNNDSHAIDESILSKLCQQLELAGLEAILAIEQPQDLSVLQSYANALLVPGKQMFNKALLTALGSSSLPVLLERNTMATEAEWLASAEIFLQAGNQQLVLCESGVRNFNHPEALEVDLTSLVNVRATSHLPVIVNLSYSKHNAEAMALAASKLGASGLVLNALEDIEVSQSLLAELYQAE
ncbi:prephenate dehydratase [Shewanella sp. C32]|uniref:Prephenate dehydratase n=1 Tax=Shewanella electrica TaxID=515560 RepID=A0ABT2FG32_9GAMM|nr:prephenate dehydratase [Shewanella electrica]MCH1925433.1 prephenate dehydratase [Shewanella electrica]MCS4555258.1 prephenate dehydratase [Shewanella electrica]